MLSNATRSIQRNWLLRKALLFALLVQRLEYRRELLTFSRTWIDFPQAIMSRM
jgi:hypothetical protein